MHEKRFVAYGIFLAAAFWVSQPAAVLGQSAGATQSPADSSVVRKTGAVTAINGSTLTVKTDSGVEVKVVVQENARILRLLPGQTDLKSAAAIQLQEAQVGDRVLVRGKVADDGASIAASMLVVMKQTDVAQKQQRDREEWQKNGVGGIVRTVNAADNTITIATSPRDSILVHVAKTTGFLRYAPGSVKFSDAKPGSFDQIKAGDQFRARGAKSSDGKELTADEVISGAFQNIAGTILSVDASAVSVKDVLTKKTIVVKIATDSLMRSLPQPMAQRIAMMLKGPDANGQNGDAAAHPRAQDTGSGAAPQGNGRSGGPPDFQRMLSRLPEIKIADLQKDQAVIIVATEPVSDAPGTAITLLTGVEPILTASPGASGAAGLFSSWNLSSSGDVQ